MDNIKQNQINGEFSKVVTSPELFDALQHIENVLGLHIDQTGELYVIISDILTRKDTSENFTKNVVDKLNVTNEQATKISKMVDEEIFRVIKNSMREQVDTQNHSATIEHIERVGGFSIEKETAPQVTTVTSQDRDKILQHLEYPPEVPRTRHTEHTEPLVDHLLQNAVASPEHKQPADAPIPGNLPIVDTAPTPQAPVTPSIPTAQTTPSPIAPQTPEAPKQTTSPKPQPERSGPDPYREPFN